MKQSDTIFKYWSSLTSSELGAIMFSINAVSDNRVDMSHLAHVNLEFAAQCLRDVTNKDISEVQKRKCKSALEKLHRGADSVTFRMKLRDKQVLYMSRQCGDALELTLPFKIVTEAGLQWKVFGKKWVKPEIEVNRVAILRQIKSGLWSITVHKSVEQLTKDYLHRRCG